MSDALYFVSHFFTNAYSCFTHVQYPVLGMSCAAVLIGIAFIKFSISFIQRFIGGSSGVSNSDASENHVIVRRK